MEKKEKDITKSNLLDAVDDILIEELVDDLSELSSEEIIEFRFNQWDYSKLAEYITGIRPDNPEMLKLLTLEQKKLREKYSLPPIDWVLDNPTEYERFLKEKAKKNRTHIRDRLDCGKYFKENFSTEGVFSYESNSIGVDINRTDLKNYCKSIKILEHEVIHSLQAIKYPRMPIEISEYEAYVANENLRENYEDEVFFHILGSIDGWYEKVNKLMEENSSETIVPEWRDPEYFLRNVDKIDEEDIENYKRQNIY